MKLRQYLACAATLAAAAGWGEARASQIYWSNGPAPAGLDRATVRNLPVGTVVIPAPEREALRAPGLTALELPPGTEAFVVALPHGADDARVLATVSTVLRVEGGYALIAVAPARVTDPLLELYHRERLTYIPRTPARIAVTASPTSASAVDPQVKAQIVAAINQAKFAQTVRELSGDLVFWLGGQLKSVNNRHSSKPGNSLAADYLQDRLQAMGYPVQRQNFMVSTVLTQNVIATKTGTVNPDQIIVIGGHYDSTSNDINSRAPGAEDNGTGTSGVLELARVFASYQTEKTIQFIGFSGEEQGLIGSQYYAQQLATNGWHVIDAMVMDMISAYRSNFAVIIEGETWIEPLMSLYEGNVNQFAGIGTRKDYNSWGSDHVPLQQAGIPCFLAIDMDYGAYPWYHNIDDKWSSPCVTEGRPCIDPTLGYAILKAMAGALADLAVPQPLSTPAPPAPAAPRLALLQNAPNPFNPSTVIPFELAAPGQVRLEIYDSAGRRVRRLIEASLPAGPGSVRWDGSDDQGRAVASGLYHYRLVTDDGVLSRRMVLAR